MLNSRYLQKVQHGLDPRRKLNMERVNGSIKLAVLHGVELEKNEVSEILILLNGPTPLPTALPEMVFQSSSLCPDQDSSTMSYSVTNFRHTCEMLRLTAAPLDEMYVSPKSTMYALDHRDG